MVGCHPPVCLVCLWPPAAFSFDQSLLWTAPFWTTLSVGYKRSKRARKDTDGKLLDSCKLAESCDLIFYLWPAPLICVARPSQPRLTPASSHNKIRAAPIWCRNKVAWKLFFLKNWGSMERTLADINEGANRGEYLMVELYNWLPELCLSLTPKSRTNWQESSAEIRVKPKRVGSLFDKNNIIVCIAGLW